MHKLVYNVFKTIMLSIIFIFVFDIVFYMYRVSSLNARMESVSTSMKKVVMENNYLPSEVADTYSEIFAKMICDYNGAVYSPGMSNNELRMTSMTGQGVVNTSAFIAGMNWNYHTNAVNANLGITATRTRWNGHDWEVKSGVNIVKTKMDTPANYGDVMVVQIRVGVFQPIWGWGAASGQYNYNGQDVNSWVRSAASTELVYTYYVPCLNFRTVTNS